MGVKSQRPPLQKPSHSSGRPRTQSGPVSRRVGADGDDVGGVPDVRPARHVHDRGDGSAAHGALVRRPREHELPAMPAQAAVPAVQQHLCGASAMHA